MICSICKLTILLKVESSFPPHVVFSKVDLYVAIYEYDPKTMSPNTNSFEEELSFTEGQLIKVCLSMPPSGISFFCEKAWKFMLSY